MKIVRIFFLLMWIGVISMILYWPKFSSHFGKKTLNVFTWGDVIEPSSIKEFEKRSGVKVKLNCYSTNEELIVKLKSLKGKGYDVVLPTDYSVEILAKEGLLKKIDKSKLHFFQKIEPALQGLDYDPQNDYSIPFQWEIHGFAIDKNYFHGKPFLPSLKQIFDENTIDYSIAMVDDPIDAINYAAFYLFGPVKTLNKEQMNQVKELLLLQKKWIEAYAQLRAEYFLATKSCPLVLTSSSYTQLMEKDFEFMEFVVPEDHFFIAIENISIPIGTEKEDLIYEFLNYLYQDNVMIKQCKYSYMFPSTKTARLQMDFNEKQLKLIGHLYEKHKSLDFFRHLTSDQETLELWVEVKSSSKK